MKMVVGKLRGEVLHEVEGGALDDAVQDLVAALLHAPSHPLDRAGREVRREQLDGTGRAPGRVDHHRDPPVRRVGFVVHQRAGREQVG